MNSTAGKIKLILWATIYGVGTGVLALGIFFYALSAVFQDPVLPPGEPGWEIIGYGALIIWPFIFAFGLRKLKNHFLKPV